MNTGVWDAVVVGAGPAGSAVAARLARAGHRTLLLEREEFPRAKPCGECLNPAAVQALKRLGAIEAVRAEGPAELYGWRIHPVAGAPIEGGFAAGTHGLALPRTRLDTVLLEHARAAGAEVRLRTHVSDLLREGERIVGVRGGRRAGGEEIRARIVIGADGLRSVVVRRLGLIRRPPRLRKLALTAHVQGVEGLDGWGDLYVFRWGCIGVARIGAARANVTVVVAGAAAAEVAGDREGYFRRALRNVRALSCAEREGEVLATGPFDWPTRGAAAPGALLVGDAAGYYDPFTGQGMYRALYGAELAAEVADAALRQDGVSLDVLSAYDAARRRAFSPGMRLQRLIEAFVARPKLLNTAAMWLRKRPALADAVIAVAGDQKPVRFLLRPRHWKKVP